VKQKEFGVKGPEVTIIGQGTWYIDRGDRKSAVAALRRGIELGMTPIDTAEMYGDAELVIADAIAGGKRDDLYLVSKVLPSNASRRGGRGRGQDRLQPGALSFAGARDRACCDPVVRAARRRRRRLFAVRPQ
jgi:diketogulonate reductase-like aldo/keto reductase